MQAYLGALGVSIQKPTGYVTIGDFKVKKRKFNN